MTQLREHTERAEQQRVLQNRQKQQELGKMFEEVVGGVGEYKKQNTKQVNDQLRAMIRKVERAEAESYRVLTTQKRRIKNLNDEIVALRAELKESKRREQQTNKERVKTEAALSAMKISRIEDDV